MKKNFQKIRWLLAKNPFFLIGSFCTPHSIFLCILTLAFDRAVLYGNDTILILVLST